MVRQLGISATVLAALATGLGPAAAAPRGWGSDSLRVAILLGRSAEGRPIVALRVGDPDSGRRLLVVGCIHGNEPAGIAVARRLARYPGSATGWQDHTQPRSTAFVVELPPGRLSEARATSFASAALAVAAEASPPGLAERAEVGSPWG